MSSSEAGSAHCESPEEPLQRFTLVIKHGTMHPIGIWHGYDVGSRASDGIDSRDAASSRLECACPQPCMLAALQRVA